MFRMNTIVLALDGSEAAKRAIPFARGLARESKSRIVIAHVDERMGTRGRAPIDTEEEGIQTEIQTLLKDLADEGIEARFETGEMISRGAEIAHAIADIAEKSKADLIVTGTRGHSEIPGLFVGSVTQRLLHICKQPVLAVPGSAEFTRGEAPFKTIVLALDGSEGSKRAIPVARELARLGGAKIVIAHIEERTIGKGGGPIHPDEEEIRAEIDKLAEELSNEGTETKVRAADVMVGRPAHVIASIADESGAGLIVTGTRGHTAVSGLLLGGVTLRLLHIARKPVLAVPEER